MNYKKNHNILNYIGKSQVNQNKNLRLIRSDLIEHLTNNSTQVHAITLIYFLSAPYTLKSFLYRIRDLSDANNKDNQKLLIRYINCIEHARSLKYKFTVRYIFIELCALYYDLVVKHRAYKSSHKNFDEKLVKDMLRNSIEIFCQLYSTTFGWQFHIKNCDRKGVAYRFLVLTGGDKKNYEAKPYIFNYNILGEAKKIEDIEEQKSELEESLMNDEREAVIIDINGNTKVIDENTRQKYLDELLSPYRFLESSKKILARPLEHIKEHGDKKIKEEVFIILSYFDNKDCNNIPFNKILPQIIKVLYNFSIFLDEQEVGFKDCYYKNGIQLNDFIFNRIWEWLYHFKFRLPCYNEILQGKKLQECLGSIYKYLTKDNITTSNNFDSWKCLIKDLKLTSYPSDTPIDILSLATNCFSSQKEFDDFCKLYNIKPSIRKYLLDKNPHLSDITNDIYSKECEKKINSKIAKPSTKEAIDNEVDLHSKKIQEALESAENLPSLPRYNEMFSEEHAQILLDKLRFKNEFPLVCSEDKNQDNFMSMAITINTVEKINQLAIDLYKSIHKDKINITDDVGKLKVFILSVFNEFAIQELNIQN